MILCSDGDQTALQSSPGSPRYRTKGAGSYLGQGGQIVQKGHPWRRRRVAGSGGESRTVGANHAKKAFCSVIIIFC